METPLSETQIFAPPKYNDLTPKKLIAMFATTQPALIIIDLQNAIDVFSDHHRSNPSAEAHIAHLLDLWRKYRLPIIHVRHSSKHCASPYHAQSPYFNFKAEAMPIENETIVTKQENCGFIDTSLASILEKQHISELVICGVLINHSVDVTVRMAAALGFTVWVPHDCTAAYDMPLLNHAILNAEDVHWTFLTNLDKEYCTVCSSMDIIQSVDQHHANSPSSN